MKHTLAFDSPRFTWAIASSLSPIEWLEYLRFLDGESMTTKWLKQQDIFCVKVIADLRLVIYEMSRFSHLLNATNKFQEKKATF